MDADPNPEDTDLARRIDAIRAGDPRAEARFVEAYRDTVRRSMRVRGRIAKLQGPMDSEDLTQSVLVDALAAIRDPLRTFADESAMCGFLAVLGRNRIRDELRRANAAKRNPGNALVGGSAVDAAPARQTSPSEVASIGEQVARVRGATSPSELALLQEKLNGAEWQELGEAAGTTADAIRKRVERIRRRVADALANGTTPKANE